MRISDWSSDVCSSDLSLLRNCDGEVGPLGGTEEATGHLFERVRGGLFARTQFARALAGDVAEGAPERAQAVPTGLQCDVEDGHVRVAQQRGGASEPAREQVAVRRHRSEEHTSELQ